MWTQCWLDYKEDGDKTAVFEKYFNGVSFPSNAEVSAAFDEINKQIKKDSEELKNKLADIERLFQTVNF